MLDEMTHLIKSEIKRQYKSVRRFSEQSGIPYSTLSNALAKGVGGTSYDTVMKICRMLHLRQIPKVDTETDSLGLQARFSHVFAMLSVLDTQGLHTVAAVLAVEYERCTHASVSDQTAYVRAFDGLTDIVIPTGEKTAGSDAKEQSDNVKHVGARQENLKRKEENK